MAAATPTAGANLNAVPAPVKQTLSGNYLSFTGGDNDWSQQYLPELYEAEVERYGDRSVSSFLRMVGAEMPMSSDQIIWSEQGRLHLSYTGALVIATGVVTIASSGTHAVRVGQTVVIKGATSGLVAKAYVSAVNAGATTLTLKRYDKAAFNTSGSAFTDGETVNLFVFGSEFKKGTNGMTGAVTPSFATFTNNPIIIKDKYEISGSDAAQIGWVEVTGEAGQTGFLWYLKAEGDTRTRFEDYLEMAMVEGEAAAASSGAAGEGLVGTEGLFAAIEDRGHITAGVVGSSAADDLGSFDEILKKLDKQGAIEENMLFNNREVSLAIDDMLAAQNSYGAGGTSYGVFNNSADMALNLGFSGFRRGSYDFYKTDWKYLNDAVTRGLVDDVRGVLVPAGTSTVYDKILGKNIKRPFLHVRYRASEADDRKMKSWVTGSVGGASTSDLDAMEVHYLSERCLVVQGANNFMLFV